MEGIYSENDKMSFSEFIIKIKMTRNNPLITIGITSKELFQAIKENAIKEGYDNELSFFSKLLLVRQLKLDERILCIKK